MVIVITVARSFLFMALILEKFNISAAMVDATPII